jgi:hypothetical protein
MFDRIKMEWLWKDHEKVVWSLQTAKTCPKKRWKSLGNYSTIQIRTFTVAEELTNVWIAPTLLWVLCSFLWSASSLLNLKIWCLAEDKRYWHTNGNKSQDTCEPVGCSVWGAKSLRSHGKELLKHPYKIRAIHQLSPLPWEARSRYCRRFCESVSKGFIDPELVFFSDEACFILIVTSRNKWWSKNSQVVYQVSSLHISQSLVFC